MWSKRKLPKWARTMVAIIAVWDVVWKGMALWQAAKRRQPGWFVALLVLNTAGVFPIAYIWMMRRRDAAAATLEADAAWTTEAVTEDA